MPFFVVVFYQPCLKDAGNVLECYFDGQVLLRFLLKGFQKLKDLPIIPAPFCFALLQEELIDIYLIEGTLRPLVFF